MQIYEELVARGLIAQVTNEEEIKKMVNEGKAVFYIGFDPTADSLHVARQVLQLLLDERFSGVSAHIKMLPMLKTLTEA